MLVTEEAVAIKEGLSPPKETYDPSWIFVKPKAKVGDKWKFDLPLGGTAHQQIQRYRNPTYNYTAAGIEKVEVLAGMFEAVKVEEESKSSSRTVWFAPRIGEVKAVTHTGPEKGEIRVLHKFTLGKEKVAPDDTSRP